jgi:hypothetical protein
MTRQKQLGRPFSATALPGAASDFLLEPLRIYSPQRGGAYRPEIDGLRALAVVAVIANHLDQSIARDGFLGVDIFFVLSGYPTRAPKPALLQNGRKNLVCLRAPPLSHSHLVIVYTILP